MRFIAALLLCLAPLSAQACVASHYGVGDGYGGRKTASGERMNPHAMTAAHRTWAFGSLVRVSHRTKFSRETKSVVVRITDRGPFVHGRCIDLSYGAARAIGITGTGSVTLERL